ncbi:2-dehydropantoate 2-reductase [Bacillus cytotoxicus NVH 391-98]|uniref:2-dehydropantoate 2-reductase n=2 Tax=Bacillus cytotoxicus TaxID=580165 RepID=A7GRP6_BACCN|nr:2-dehydropantoate 2-reductase [Bacillus cytotoxicus NVH 391-98]
MSINMKIGIVGPGAIGLLYAFYFKKSNQDVTLFTRTVEQAKQLEKTGVTCIQDEISETVFPKVLPVESVEKENWDYIFIAVKQYHVNHILPFLSKQRVVFLQNGMSHLQLIKELQCENIAVGIVEHGAKKENFHTVCHTGVGITKFGVVKGDVLQFEPIFECFASQRFSMQFEDDWKQMMYNKLIVNVCINPLTALFGVCNGELISNPFFYQSMKQVFQEVTFLIEKEKEEELWNMVCQVCQKTSCNTSSMLADIREKRKTEIEAIVGYVLDEAKARQKQVHILPFLYNAIRGLET